MKKLDLFEAIGEADVKYLAESEKEQTGSPYKPDSVFKTLAAAAAFVLIFGAMAILPRLIFGDIRPSGPYDDVTQEESTVSETEAEISEDTTAVFENLPAQVVVIDAYSKAEKAANLFRLSQHGLSYDSDDTLTLNGVLYHRVTNYATYGDFIEYLHSLFSEDVVKSLIESGSAFIEHDGKLYFTPAERGSNLCIEDVLLEYKAVSDTRIDIIAHVSINDFADRTNPTPTGRIIDTVDVLFPYENVGGRWVFTDFPDIALIDTEVYVGITVEIMPEIYNFYTLADVTLVLPKEFEGRYAVFMNSPEALGLEQLTVNRSDAAYYDNNMLFEVFYRNISEADYGRSYTALYRIVRYSIGEYERNVLAENVARRDVLGFDGEYYYVMLYPAGAVTAPDSYYYTVVNLCEESAKQIFGRYNGLIKADPADFYAKTYTYEGEHKYYRYYPYGTSREDFYHTLVLSQPADQGADGIWCVERWYSGSSDGGSGYIHPEFPASGDLSASEFYAELQGNVSAGRTAVPMMYLDPISVAVTFARDTFGHDFADASYFVETGSLPDGEWNY